MVNKAFIYIYFSANGNHHAEFLGSPDFNGIKSKTTTIKPTCWWMQLIHCYHSQKFPFFIALDSLRSQLFLVNSLTNKRTPMIDLKKVHS